MKTNILLALADETWQLEAMTTLNDQPQLKIKRRCVDSVDLIAALHSGLATKVVISADFPNLSSITISSAKKLECEIFGIYIQDDRDSLEKLNGLGVKDNFALNQIDIGKSMINIIRQLSQDTEVEKFIENDNNANKIPGLISVWGTHGSPGRTTTAINVAFQLAADNFPTLLIDLDADAPSISAALGLVSEVPGISSVIHDAVKGRLSLESIEKNVIEVSKGLHVLTGISNPNRWPELRTDGLIQVLKLCSQIYQNIVCDLSAILPEATDESISDLNIFKRFDHVSRVLEVSQKVIFVLSATPLSLIRASESLEKLSEISSQEPIIILNKINTFSLEGVYQDTVTAILGRWSNPELIQRVPERPEIFAKSWMKAESVLRLGDKELNDIFSSLSKIVTNEIVPEQKVRRFLRRVG